MTIHRTLLLFLVCTAAIAEDGIKSKTTYAKAYGATKGNATVDPIKELPHYPAVEPKDAIATWKVKKGFHLELTANEPQVSDPIALCFDENGRMFVCEMIDYSEMRDVTPHLGRISMLEDKDGDGHFETSTIFADDLPWPTGLIWANGGLFVGATPDIWRFEDKDGDGKAEVREKIFTGIGTGLKLLNVQGLMNSFQWGIDNRVHILAGGGNRGVVTCLKHPEVPGQELGGKDLWFDPVTYEFGMETGGAQYGMSYDTYGRKFGCSNSDHLQYWVYDDRFANRSNNVPMPPSRQSIAADGGAAEVFRISPDEPWRIIRTRWRIAGVVKGVAEGGGRVSGYFTGATGTTIFRGDAYGPEFVNNSFSGDAGGQLVHRKIIRPTEDGISLVGERPADEHGFEFAASKDTWVRVVNFANAPDGCLHICDMYREVIEHPWSIPDEIKQHLDLNNGNNRGRIFRITPDDPQWKRRTGVKLGSASTEELVATLGHTNGWHRDTAARLLFERQDKTAVPLLHKVISGDNSMAKLHALSALRGLKALTDDDILAALHDSDSQVIERALRFAGPLTAPVATALVDLAKKTASPRVLLETALRVSEPEANGITNADDIILDIIDKTHAEPTVLASCLNGSHDATAIFLPLLKKASADARLIPAVAALATTIGTHNQPDRVRQAIKALVTEKAVAAQLPTLLTALKTGLAKAGTTIEKADSEGALDQLFQTAATTLADTGKPEEARTQVLELISLSNAPAATAALEACLSAGQPDALQAAVIRTLGQRTAKSTAAAIILGWPNYGTKGKEAALAALTARDDRAPSLLEAIKTNTIKATELPLAQVQALVQHKDAKLAALAKTTLASVIPPSREEMLAKYQPAIAMQGEATAGQNQFISRCMACHRAGTLGVQVGPDLITVKTKGREALLTAIIEPHKEVAPQFIAYTLATKDGQTLVGVIAQDEASSVKLRMMGGIEQTVQRANIKGTQSSGQSLMPEGIEAGMSVDDMANLLTFIESLR